MVKQTKQQQAPRTNEDLLVKSQVRRRQGAVAEGHRVVACAERCALPQSARLLQVSVPAWAPRLGGATDSAARNDRRLNTSVDGLVGKKVFQQLGQRLVSAR